MVKGMAKPKNGKKALAQYPIKGTRKVVKGNNSALPPFSSPIPWGRKKKKAPCCFGNLSFRFRHPQFDNSLHSSEIPRLGVEVKWVMGYGSFYAVHRDYRGLDASDESVPEMMFVGLGN